jgi:hypothetical protein
MRYERPLLDEPVPSGGLSRFLQNTRRRAGAAPMERMFVERVRAEIAAGDKLLSGSPAEAAPNGAAAD